MALAGCTKAVVSLNALSLSSGRTQNCGPIAATASTPVHRLSSSAAHGVQLPPIQPLTVAPKHSEKGLRVQATVAAAPAEVSKGVAQEEGRVFNFAAGPACLPYNVLKEAQTDLINWKVSLI